MSPELEFRGMIDKHVVVVGYDHDRSGFYIQIFDAVSREWNARITDLMESEPLPWDPWRIEQLSGAQVTALIDDSMHSHGPLGFDQTCTMLMMIARGLTQQDFDEISKLQERMQ